MREIEDSREQQPASGLVVVRKLFVVNKASITQLGEELAVDRDFRDLLGVSEPGPRLRCTILEVDPGLNHLCWASWHLAWSAPHHVGLALFGA